MRGWLLPAACAALFWRAAPAPAQAPSAPDCEIVHADDLRAVDQGTPAERLILRGRAHIECRGGVLVRADSMVSHTASGRREFIGHVLFEDTVKSLTADRVDYEHAQGRLVARGNVVLTDLQNGSVVRDGSVLEYLRTTASRPESRTIIRGRPHATLYDAAPAGEDASPRPGTGATAADAAPVGSPPAVATVGTGADTAAAEPLEIDADVMEIIGEQRFRATGGVELRRGQTTGSAAEADFDQVDGRVVLRGDAMVEGETFTLTGERVVAWLAGEALREVHALEEAILLSEELRVDAPELRIFFRDGAVHRMVAMRLPDTTAAADPAAAAAGDPREARRVAESGADATVAVPSVAGDAATRDGAPGDSAGAGAPTAELAAAPPPGPARTVGPQPRATAKDFWLAADSIDALAPGQRLETVVAVGNAYGERTADSLTAQLPELIARDWIRGDTITGYFGVVREPASTAAGAATDSTGDASPGGAPGDSVRERTVLERLVAVGPEGTAQSLYRIREEGAESGPSVNYLTANRIVLFLENGEVTSVEAEGPVRGYHLQPRNDGGGDPDPGVADAAPPGSGPPPPER
ncbi:MAG TPA: hypothetical protein VF158_06930 [Longimicrobiales bacterium]